jgi:lipopolysaccharide export system permease protein
MNRLTHYILRQTLVVMLFVTAAFSAAVWLVQSLRLIDLIVNRGLSVGLFLYLAVLILPRFVDVVLPIAVFVAVLFTYNKLIAESELVVMRASGMSPAALARPALLVGMVGMVVLYALSLYFLPVANRAFKDLQFEIRNRFASVLIQEGIFNTLSDRLTVYVKSREANGELESLLIHDTRDPAKPVTIFAERGAFVDTDGGPRIVMVNGNRQQRDGATGRLSSLTFEKYTLDLAALGDAPGVRDRQPDERFLHELLFPTSQGVRRAPDRSLLVEANMRLVNPLTAVAMAVLPVVCLLLGEFNRRGQSRRVLLAIFLAFVLEVSDVGLKNLAGRSGIAIAMLYANVVLPIAGTAWLLWRDGSGARGVRRRLVADAAS